MKHELQQTARQHRPSQGHDRWVEIRREEQGEEDHRDVEQGRHERRHRETVPGIEDCAGQGRQRDQQNIRKGHSQQISGELKFLFTVDEARGRGPDYPGRGQHTQCGHQRENQRQQAGDISDKGAGRLFTLLGLVLGKNRHERLRERAFGENPAQQIGQFERDEERVGRDPGAENTRQDRVTYKTQHP